MLMIIRENIKCVVPKLFILENHSVNNLWTNLHLITNLEIKYIYLNNIFNFKKYMLVNPIYIIICR